MTLIPPSSRFPPVAGPGNAQDPLQSGLGLLGWNFSPYAITGGGGLTSQLVYALVLSTEASVVYTGLELMIFTAGSGTTPTGFFVGLASNANIGSAGTMLAQSSNLNGSASLTTAGVQRFPFNATYTETASGNRVALVFENGAFGTTNVQPAKSNLTNQFGSAAGAAGLAMSAGGGVTAFPANGSPLVSNYSGSSALAWWVGLY